MKYAIERVSGGMINMRRFVRTGSGILLYKAYYFNNIRDFNVGITDWRDLKVRR
jgi:hypothetical protein